MRESVADLSENLPYEKIPVVGKQVGPAVSKLVSNVIENYPDPGSSDPKPNNTSTITGGTSPDPAPLANVVPNYSAPPTPSPLATPAPAPSNGVPPYLAPNPPPPMYTPAPISQPVTNPAPDPNNVPLQRQTNNTPAQPPVAQAGLRAPASTPTTPPTQVAILNPNSATAPPGSTPPAAQAAGPDPDPLPGGISLNRAAAKRLALDLDLEGAYLEDGRIVLSGQAGRSMRVDASLFLTSIRLACTGTDPYFSLDPDDGGLWQKEGNAASDEIWNVIKSDLELEGEKWWENIPKGLSLRSFSAKKHYAQQWNAISRKYPNFKTRLVFEPKWLGDTRFGEIFYIGDVLLKELSGGVQTIAASDKALRASKVDGYVSSGVLSASERLLMNVDGGESVKPDYLGGTRFWFDLVPGAKSRMRSMLDDDPIVAKPYVPSTALGKRLKGELPQLGARNQGPGSLVRRVSMEGGALDLSRVYPTMFVIGHDHVTNKDLNSDDPFHLAVANDVNERMPLYVEAYEELKQLTEVFRLYVAAVALVQRQSGSELCQSVSKLPLLDSELVDFPLPEYRPSDLHFTIASYRAKDEKGSDRSWYSTSNSYSGGVSPGGQQLYADAQKTTTPVSQTILADVTGMRQRDSWTTKSGRNYVAFVIDDPSKPVAAGPRPTGQRNGLLDDFDTNDTGLTTLPNR